MDLVSGGDVLVSNARFPSASDYQEVPAGSVDLEVRKAGSGEVLAKADNVKLASGSISSLVAVGGIGEKLELLDIRDAATAVSAAGGVATGAGGTSTEPQHRRSEVRPAPAHRRRPGRGRRVRRPAAAVDRVGHSGCHDQGRRSAGGWSC